MEEQGFDTTITADGVFRLLEAAYEVLPDIGELELVDARAGLRPFTPDNLPVVGAGSIDGLSWATGHGRNGVLLAPLTAARLVDCLRGAPPAGEGLDMPGHGARRLNGEEHPLPDGATAADAVRAAGAAQDGRGRGRGAGRRGGAARALGGYGAPGRRPGRGPAGRAGRMRQ